MCLCTSNVNGLADAEPVGPPSSPPSRADYTRMLPTLRPIRTIERGDSASVKNRRDRLLDVLDRDRVNVEIGEPLEVAQASDLSARMSSTPSVYSFQWSRIA